ncbi:Stringent starvation protein B [Aquicella lusitana]|uniref:Stringent starvation protein B n=2 Tax=Aquicella lusitana TaxID=254246 RepID=A0A370GNA2_9COXI|nr:stringent starvation protein B [Aquicella lusitana]VVC72953.1 Stringent starvation protein B [Aquicella lusitana]
MLSNRPYLLRAFYQWIVDSACTPILVIDANHPRCRIPKEYAEGGEIVFNISSVAVRDLKITNELVEFKASFSGVIHFISAPIKAILAIYAEENGEGIFFDADEDDSEGEERNGIVELKALEGFSNADASDADIIASEQTREKPVLRLVE